MSCCKRLACCRRLFFQSFSEFLIVFLCFFSLGGNLGRSLGTLGGSKGHRRSSLGTLGGSKGHRRSWVLGVLGASLGRLWSALGATLGCLWSARRARSAPNASHSEVSEGVPGASLGRVCNALGGPCCVLEGSRGSLGRPWGVFGVQKSRHVLEKVTSEPARHSGTHANHVTARCKHYVSMNTLD